MTTNESAAVWWANQLLIPDRREAFRLALVDILDADEWRNLYVDYDPDQTLRTALYNAGISVPVGVMTAKDIFPYKTGMRNRDGVLWARVGAGNPYVNIATGEKWSEIETG